MAGRSSGVVDAHVGNRVRLRRMLRSMSREALGDGLGITFQQVQKYEMGVNRISAGRLFQIATLLAVDIGYFFEDAPDPGVRPGQIGPTSERSLLEFLNTREGLELNRAFNAIADRGRRKAIIDLIRAINDTGSAKAT